MDESNGCINPELITSSSSSSDGWDSDEEDGKNVKYQPLPQDPVENGESSDVNNYSEDDIEEVKSKDVTQDSSPRLSMDEGHADVVVKAMAGFSLSPSNIPEWAKVVPEEVWKNELLDRLKPKQ